MMKEITDLYIFSVICAVISSLQASPYAHVSQVVDVSSKDTCQGANRPVEVA